MIWPLSLFFHGHATVAAPQRTQSLPGDFDAAVQAVVSAYRALPADAPVARAADDMLERLLHRHYDDNLRQMIIAETVFPVIANHPNDAVFLNSAVRSRIFLNSDARLKVGMIAMEASQKYFVQSAQPDSSREDLDRALRLASEAMHSTASIRDERRDPIVAHYTAVLTDDSKRGIGDALQTIHMNLTHLGEDEALVTLSKNFRDKLMPMLDRVARSDAKQANYAMVVVFGFLQNDPEALQAHYKQWLGYAEDLWVLDAPEYAIAAGAHVNSDDWFRPELAEMSIQFLENASFLWAATGQHTDMAFDAQEEITMLQRRISLAKQGVHKMDGPLKPYPVG